MTTVAAHYDRLLAEHYTWMLGGDIEAIAARERPLLQELGVAGVARRGAVAIDLGCGSGAQTLALADLGFQTVVAIDQSRALLDELAAHAARRPSITIVCDDLVRALTKVDAPVQAIVCMRDTILCLADRAAVVGLIERAAEALAAGGVLALSYRDLSEPLEGLDRFLPVRSDADRIMLCALDYGPETVTTTDLVYVRGADGWQLHKSSYPKLRIEPDWLAEALAGAGLTVTVHQRSPGGMWLTAATGGGTLT